MRTNKLTVEKILSETNSSDWARSMSQAKVGDVDEARELLLCMRLWIRVRMTNLARTGEVEGE